MPRRTPFSYLVGSRLPLRLAAVALVFAVTAAGCLRSSGAASKHDRGGQGCEQWILDSVFEGFQHEVIDVGLTTIAVRSGGGGAAVLLLHGFPETHVMWHRVAPALAEDFAVVCADLRGYGASGTPPSTPDHAPYAKSAM